ncbi:MAG TPA: alcohol dehydrogenase catalytic domain-containing protein [Rectinemataceae bacterium]|nr:alcohol dehydrogenase catalytic domain-containing protein [Rectinemataceae bacterium]
MKTALLQAAKKISIGETQAPAAGPGQILIRPAYAGICGSDVSLFLGHRAVASFPHVLGHEIVGRVEALGEGVTKLSVGQRVVVEPNYTCGVCEFCRSGRGNICPDKKSAGVNLPGFFSELCVAPAEFSWPVGEEISDADAVTIEPLAVAVHALRHSGARLGDTVAVVGCGAIGLLLVQAALAHGLRVIAHEMSAKKLSMARELGAIIPSGDDVAALWKKEGVTKIFDTTGVNATVELALASAPRGSEIFLLGLATEAAKFVPLRFVREGLRLSGSLIYDHPFDFPATISLVSRRILKPSRIVTDTIPFAEIDRAFELASSGGAAKVLIKM